MQDSLTSFSSLLHKNMEREMDAFLSMYAQHIDVEQLRTKSPGLEPLANVYIKAGGLTQEKKKGRLHTERKGAER